MSMILDERTVGIWFLGLDSDTDWLCCLREEEPDKRYVATYRFRYYSADSKNPFDEKDSKSWYTLTIKDKSKNFATFMIRDIANMLVEKGASGKLYELLNTEGVDKFMREFIKLPFAYARMAKPGEFPDA